MPPDQRIKELCAQLLRAQNPAVIQTVAEQLKVTIDEYVRKVGSDFSIIEFTPSLEPSI